MRSFSIKTGVELSSPVILLLVYVTGTNPERAFGAEAGITQEGVISVYTAPAPGTAAATAPAATQSSVDFVNAKPMKLPVASEFSLDRAVENLSASNALAPKAGSISPQSGSVSLEERKGKTGTGTQAAEKVGVPAPQGDGGGNAPIAPAQAGTSNLPFSTARSDLDPAQTNTAYPYRASGKLFFLIGSDTYICSASLIKRGLVVTAAHCVAEWHKQQYHSDWQFIPGYRNGDAPYGKWTVAQARVLASYFRDGNDCDQNSPGVVCQDDVAVLVLNPKKDTNGRTYYAGDNTGWYAYGVNTAGFIQGFTHLTQVGYPACLDNGAMMERNDTQGAVSGAYLNNTIAGSLMCGGSSGGPWLINFGIQPNLTGTGLGSSPEPNEVIGVTSWGSADTAVKQMGASPFTDSNIGVLVKAACDAYADACRGP